MKKKQLLISVLALMSICMTACGTDSTVPKEVAAGQSAAETVTETTTLAENAAQTTEQTTAAAASRTEAAENTDAQQTSAQNASAEDYSAIAGEWVRGDGVYADNYLSIDAAGAFTAENVRGERFSGSVKTENGAYSFYKADGSLWNSFAEKKAGTGSTWLYAKKNTDSAKIHFEDVDEAEYNLEDVTFVRCDAAAALRQIAGEWRETTAGTDGNTLNIQEDGSFTFTADGQATEGLIHVSGDIHPDDSVSFWYNFCKKDGTFWEGVSFTGVPEEFAQLSTGQDGGRVFARVQAGAE